MKGVGTGGWQQDRHFMDWGLHPLHFKGWRKGTREHDQIWGGVWKGNIKPEFPSGKNLGTEMVPGWLN